MGNYKSYAEAEERIVAYFLEFIDDMNINDAISSYTKETLPYIVNLLMPYALDNNYWWEEKSEKMAYYQMRLRDFVVDYNDFTYYYEKLMGKKYDAYDFSTGEKRLAMYQEADEKYKQLTNPNKRAR